MPTDAQVEAAAEAMLDEVERDNAEQGMFGGDMPRETYRKGFTRYCRAALEAAEAAAWLPIEAAPKDGTYFLGVFFDGFMAVMRYDSCFWQIAYGPQFRQDSLVMWRPLPAPPRRDEER